MVYHITNYMRETNVWMIRKMRWILWSFCGYLCFYRNVYWDYHARRVAWKEYFNFSSEKEKAEEAKKKKGNWGYHPRYEPVYDFSIKARRYATQTKSEKVRDTPRLMATGNRFERRGLMDTEKVHTFMYILREHNRIPGKFNYNYSQDFYSCYPEIDFDSYVTIGSNQRRGVEYAYDIGQDY